MYQQFFADSHLLALPMIALSLFVLSFLAILYWVFVHLRDSSLPEYMAQLPLTDGPLIDEQPTDPAQTERPIADSESLKESSHE